MHHVDPTLASDDSPSPLLRDTHAVTLRGTSPPGTVRYGANRVVPIDHRNHAGDHIIRRFMQPAVIVIETMTRTVRHSGAHAVMRS